VKPAPFDYHAPGRLDEVMGLLDEHGDDAKVIAGGQSLIPMLAMRLTAFEHLVDLRRVEELSGTSIDDGDLVVGAMTPQRSLERDATGLGWPLLAEALGHVGHFQIRNRGTVGGSLAHADPAAELPAVAVALRAQFDVASSGGRRSIPARDFFESTWTTALTDGEVLVAARFPAPPVSSGRAGHGFYEVARRPGDFALAGAACYLEVDPEGRIIRAGIGLLGLGPATMAATAAEDALGGRPAASSGGGGLSPAELQQLGHLALEGCDPGDDVHASASYRRAAGAYAVERALADAFTRLGEAA